MMLSSSSSTTISTTLLGGLLAASVGLPLVAAAENNITVEQFYGKLTSTVTPAPGFNVEGSNVFTNFADLVNNGQFFFIRTGTFVFEKPDVDPVPTSHLNWCSDLTFSDLNNSSLIGYAGRCVVKLLGTGYANVLASGAQLAFPYSEEGFMYTTGISAVFVEQLNVFEGQFHLDTDDNTWRFWDDGRKSMPLIAWEGHDEGDMNPNAATSSFSRFSEVTWSSVDEVAQLFNTSVDEFTPEKFKQVYLDTWIKDHEEEAAENNPFPEALGILAASLPFVASAEVTVDDLLTKINPTAALPGFNVEGGSVFTKVADAMNQEQFFFIDTGSNVFESPNSVPVPISHFHWCSDFTFSDVNNSSLIGYAGRCVVRVSLDGHDDLLEAGAQLAFDYPEGGFSFSSGISAVYVEQLNVFEGQFHVNVDDNSWRFWDDGRKSMPLIAWEGHDEGDLNPNAATSSFSRFAEVTWMSVDEVAQLFNTSVDEFTPETFKKAYLDTWIKDHEFEAATNNPFPEAELEIIEQVKNETNYVDETATTTPVESDSTAVEDGGSDAANPVVQDDSDSGSGRQLVSVATRFVSAALRVLAI